jgi:hypothetical protein
MGQYYLHLLLLEIFFQQYYLHNTPLATAYRILFFKIYGCPAVPDVKDELLFSALYWPELSYVGASEPLFGLGSS